MNFKLIGKNGKNLQLNNLDNHLKKVEELKLLISKNPTKGVMDKFVSLLESETWSTLFTEGEISSRRSIEQIFKQKSLVNETDLEKYIGSFLVAYKLALEKKDFSISSFFNIYSVLAKYGIDRDDQLKDGEMFRDEKVYISSGVTKNEYEGFPADKIKDSFASLCVFLNEKDDLDLYIKAIIGHFYFEIIHPYFDFNGRTGRFIPLWLFSNHGRVEEMMYFATAMGNFRESYISIFRNTIDARTENIKLDFFVDKILDLLILNQKQYLWYKQFENKYIDLTTKSFNDIQKHFIWALMIKLEKQSNAQSWNTLDNEMKAYIETEAKQSQLARDINILVDSELVLKSSTKPIKYKLQGYKLLWNK